MPLQSSGPISFFELVREMEGLHHDQEGNDIDKTNISMSRYYGDEGLPLSGPISLSDFYGKFSVKELSFSYRGKIIGDESLYSTTPVTLTRNYDGYPLDVEIAWTDDGSTHHFTTDGTTPVNTNQTLSFPISTIENTAKQISGNVAHTPNFTIGDSTSHGYYSIVLPESAPGEYILGQYPEFSYEVRNNDFRVNTGRLNNDTSTGLAGFQYNWTTDGDYIWALANSLPNSYSSNQASIAGASYEKFYTTETESYYRRKSNTTSSNWPKRYLGRSYYNYKYSRNAAIVSSSDSNKIYVLSLKPYARSGRTTADYGLPCVITLTFYGSSIGYSERVINTSAAMSFASYTSYISHFPHNSNPTVRVYQIGQRVSTYSGASTGQYTAFWIGRNGLSGLYTSNTYDGVINYLNSINALSNDANNHEDRGFIRVFEDFINISLV